MSQVPNQTNHLGEHLSTHPIEDYWAASSSIWNRSHISMQTAVPLILGAVRSIAMATYRYKKNLQLLQVLQAFHMCRNKKNHLRRKLMSTHGPHPVDIAIWSDNRSNSLSKSASELSLLCRLHMVDQTSCSRSGWTPRNTCSIEAWSYLHEAGV